MFGFFNTARAAARYNFRLITYIDHSFVEENQPEKVITASMSLSDYRHVCQKRTSLLKYVFDIFGSGFYHLWLSLIEDVFESGRFRSHQGNRRRASGIRRFPKLL